MEYITQHNSLKNKEQRLFLEHTFWRVKKNEGI